MILLQGLHGVIAIVVLCSFLFVEESGLPLPIPGELILIAAGLLIATGGLDPAVFVPLAVLACIAGATTGYSWSRLLGEHGLNALAGKFHQAQRLEKISRKLKTASPAKIAVSRLIPGLRVYTTLVSGAVGVDRRRFLLAIVPATVAWVGIFTAAGIVAGIPAERIFGQLERLAVQGGVLIAVGVGGYLAVRRVPSGQRAALVRVPNQVKMALAMGVDMGLISAVVAGVLAVVRPLLGVGAAASWADIGVVVAVIAVFYSLATHHGSYATAGETLLGTRYLTLWQSLRTTVGSSGLSPGAASPSWLGGPPIDQPVNARRFISALDDPQRLQLTLALLVRPRTATDLANEMALPLVEVVYQLAQLSRAGLLGTPTEGDSGQFPEGAMYRLRSEAVRLALLHVSALNTGGPGQSDASP